LTILEGRTFVTKQLLLDIDDEIATVTLNNPARRNALSMEMWQDLPRVLESAARDDVRVLILRGADGHFCAGADINDVAGSLADAGVEDGYRERNTRADKALTAFSRPTIAAIEGSCVGGGVQLAVACDVRVATRSATFGITPSKLGVTYPSAALIRIASLIGPSHTKRLVFTGELFGATTAFDLGLVDILVEDNELDGVITALASSMATKSLLTQLATKAVLNEVVAHGHANNTTIQAWEATAREAGDLAEGVTAFRERRAPRFTWSPS
jgi:enoyl-CoA hydratase/carnithine racemase